MPVQLPLLPQEVFFDTEDEIKKAIDMGVDTYYTNDTALALSIEKDYGLKVRSGIDTSEEKPEED